MSIGRTRILAAGAAALAVAAAGSAHAALSTEPPSGPDKTGIVLSESSLDANPIGGKAFFVRLGRERRAGQAGDGCLVRERRDPRSFKASPFGLPATGRFQVFLTDRRRPKGLVALRWAEDPNLTPGLRPERLPIRGLRAFRFGGEPGFWQARIGLPPGVPSYLVVRAAWPDPDDCAVGPDLIKIGLAFEPLSGPAGRFRR